MIATRDQTTVIPQDRREDDRTLRVRINAEYREMPGLALTLPQAARLFDLDITRCARVLDSLVVEGALRTNGREFLGGSVGRCRP